MAAWRPTDHADGEVTDAALASPLGQTGAVSVPTTAPAASGSYDAIWRLTSPDGQVFGDPLTLAVTVSDATDHP